MTEVHLIWLHRILRWGLGLLFIGVGIKFWEEEAWPALVFGAVLLATGFFRPKRCLGEESCRVEQR